MYLLLGGDSTVAAEADKVCADVDSATAFLLSGVGGAALVNESLAGDCEDFLGDEGLLVDEVIGLIAVLELTLLFVL